MNSLAPFLWTEASTVSSSATNSTSAAFGQRLHPQGDIRSAMPL
jgi:hypothetical protein